MLVSSVRGHDDMHMPTRVPEVVQLATKFAIRPAGSWALGHHRETLNVPAVFV
jgi:hypothetical protein